MSAAHGGLELRRVVADGQQGGVGQGRYAGGRHLRTRVQQVSAELEDVSQLVREDRRHGGAEGTRLGRAGGGPGEVVVGDDHHEHRTGEDSDFSFFLVFEYWFVFVFVCSCFCFFFPSLTLFQEEDLARSLMVMITINIGQVNTCTYLFGGVSFCFCDFCVWLVCRWWFWFCFVYLFIFILRRMGINKALAHHTSTYFHTRRVSI